jgi:uncharacterized protein
MTPQPIRYLVLWLTTQCNLHCTYCYRPPEPLPRMPREVVCAALELAAASGVSFHVQLAGGEPTLEPELIEFIGSLIRRKGWPATIAIQTNATRIDPPLITTCLRYRIEMGVSLDGPPEVQQKTRGMARETYQSLALLAASEVPTRVTAVLCSKTLASAPALVLCLASFPNVRGFGFDPLVMKGGAAKRPDLLPDHAGTYGAARETCQVLALVNSRRQRPLLWREYETVRSARNGGRSRTHYCHAAQGASLAVHPSGAVYPCSQVAGEPEFAAGTLDAVDWNRLSTAFRGVRMVCPNPRCSLSGCCPGDCPSRIHFQNPSMTSVMCSLYRGIADYLVQEPS